MGDYLKSQYEKLNENMNQKKYDPFVHHIHVKYKNTIHTFAHNTDCVDLSELLSSIKEIFDEEENKK